MNEFEIYPKKAFFQGISIEKNKCFVLMPFLQELELVYGEIKEALDVGGYICNRADELGRGGKPIMATILNEILSSHFIIADLTGQNANVFYELGIAHSFKDAQNIILISQTVDDIPFDIRHLNTIIYNPNNHKLLIAKIIETIRANKHHLTFLEALQSRGIISSIRNNGEPFLDHFLAFMDSELALITSLLSGQKDGIHENDVNLLFDRYMTFICRIIENRKHAFLECSFEILAEILISCGGYSVTEDVVSRIFGRTTFATQCMKNSDLKLWQTTTAIKLAQKKVCFNYVMTWIIDYFTQSKSGVIDLNRYRLEKFLLLTTDGMINGIIADSITHSNKHIREHMADIAGEKGLQSALAPLIQQLKVEENYYTAASIFTAIGRMNSRKGGGEIIQWLKNNKEELLVRNFFFAVKHGQRALSRIDNRCDTDYVQQLHQLFSNSLEDIKSAPY